MGEGDSAPGRARVSSGGCRCWTWALDSSVVCESRKDRVIVHAYTRCAHSYVHTHVCTLHPLHRGGETLAVGTLPLIPRLLRSGGFLDEEGFRRK